MKKRIINISLALLLVLSVCLSVSFTAAAKSDKPEKLDNKPVAWVNFTGADCGGKGHTPGQYKPVFPFTDAPLPQVQLIVKRLANGNTAGHCRLRLLGIDEDMEDFFIYKEMNFEIIDSRFSMQGDTRIAEVLMYRMGIYFLWYIEDNGEPGRGNDAFALYLFMMPGIVSFADIPEPNNPPNPFYPDEWYEFNPPFYVNYLGWFPYLGYQTIAPDNVQVHITEDYQN